MAGHDRYDSRRRAWTTWLPLALTVTAAAVGIAAWMLTRSDEETEDAAPIEYDDTAAAAAAAAAAADLDYENADYGDNPAYGSGRARGEASRGLRSGVQPAGTAVNAAAESGEWGARMTRALGNAPSPGGLLDSAGRKVAAGVAAAGAAVGSALAAIREEDKSPGRDDDRCGEAGPSETRGPGKRRKTVVLVVSAEGRRGDAKDAFTQSVSILSHVPREIDFSATKLFILIYAPGLKDTGGIDSTTTPSEDPKSPSGDAGSDAVYDAVRAQALALVEDKSMVLPFTTPNGYAYMLRHLEPEIDVVYLQESLSGDDGSVVAQMQTWFRRGIVLVVGAGKETGGASDGESESDSEGREKWWEKPERVGRGSGVAVVDGARVAGDWARRVQGRSE